MPLSEFHKKLQAEARAEHKPARPPSAATGIVGEGQRVRVDMLTADWSDVGAELLRLWKLMNYAARPYAEALRNDSGGYYGVERSDDLARYFLANAGTWRGDAARQCKAALRKRLGPV